MGYLLTAAPGELTKYLKATVVGDERSKDLLADARRKQGFDCGAKLRFVEGARVIEAHDATAVHDNECRCGAGAKPVEISGAEWHAKCSGWMNRTLCKFVRMNAFSVAGSAGSLVGV